MRTLETNVKNLKFSSSLKFYLILFISATAVYSKTFEHDFALDDDVVFLNNRFVQKGIKALPDIVSHGFLYGYNGKNDQSYRPLVTANFAIDRTLFGNKPGVHHKLNALYYAILCCILFNFLQILFQNNQVWITFWISLLFVLHPIHTEVVANIKGRDDLLHGIFLLLSFTALLKYHDRKEITQLIAGLFTYFLALLCKEIAVTFIALLPLTLWFFREIELKRLFTLTGYVGVILIAYLLIRNGILDTIAFEEKMSVINNGIAAASNPAERYATTLFIFAHYIKLLIFPSPLTWDYSYPHFPIVNFSNTTVILSLIVLLVIGVASVWGIRTKNKYAFAFLFFIISFSIVSNFFVLIGATLGERFLFFPSIAFCCVIVWTIQEGVNFIKTRKQVITTSLLIIICLGYTYKTWDRSGEWKNNDSLFISGAKATPNNSRAIAALGSISMKKAERSMNQQEQINNYNKAIEYYSKSVNLLPSNFDSHYNLGVIYMATGNANQAKISFENALKYSPRMTAALNNLGVLYFNIRNFTEAKKYFEQCLSIDANFQQALANLGAIHHNLGELELARQYYNRALELNPNDQNSINNLKRLN